MAARIVGSAITGGGNVAGTTGINLTKTALETAMGRSLADGDYLVALCSRADDTGTNWQSSSGGAWNLEGQLSTSAGNDMKTAALWRKVTNAAGEPSSWTFTVASGTDTDPTQVILFAVSGADPDTFLDVTTTSNSGTNDFTPDHVDIDTTNANCLIIMFHAASMNSGVSGKSAGAPSYATGLIGSREETGGAVLESFVEGAYKDDAPSGTQTIGAWTGTADDATSEWHVITLAIRAEIVGEVKPGSASLQSEITLSSSGTRILPDMVASLTFEVSISAVVSQPPPFWYDPSMRGPMRIGAHVRFDPTLRYLSGRR